MVREERRKLEWMRQELLRKGKDLLAQNRHRRNQGYFITKHQFESYCRRTPGDF